MSDKPSQANGSSRLINPYVRGYMEAMNLQRFYGGYQAVDLPAEIYNLGIGELGNLGDPDVYQMFLDFQQRQVPSRMTTRYTGTMGVKETNAAVAGAMNAWLHVSHFTDAHVVSFDGGHNAVEAAVRAFTSPIEGKGGRPYVLMASPSYPYFSSIINAHAGVQGFVAYNGEDFAAGVEANCHEGVGLILANIPNNPMGYALDAAQVARVNAVAQQYDCAIVVDAVYANFPESDEVGRALGGFDPQRTVIVDSFSKKYGLPGLRVGFALSAVPDLVYALRFVKMGESLSPSNEKLAFAGHLLREHPNLPMAIGKMVRGRREAFLESFSPQRVEGVRAFGEQQNAFYLPLDISGVAERAGLNDAQISQYLQASHKVRTYPGAHVFPSPAIEPAFGKPGNGAPEGATLVFSPDHLERRRPLLRLSFGMETRVQEAANALAGGLKELWELGVDAKAHVEDVLEKANIAPNLWTAAAVKNKRA